MILIKTQEQIEKMRMAGRLTAKVLEAVSDFIKPGITTMPGQPRLKLILL